MIARCDGGYRYQADYPNYEQFQRERMKTAVRHWSFGIAAHGGDYQWPDSYFDNAQRKRARLDPDNKKLEEMRLFLLETSGLSQVYY